MSDYIKSKEYKLPNGRTVTADFNELGCAMVTIQAMDALFDILNSSQQWIPCSERLPREPFGCIVTVWDSTPTGEGDDFENILPYFVGWDGEQWNDGDGEQCPFEVIAWMPLPEPYKGEEL